jgi:hypothetical protein
MYQKRNKHYRQCCGSGAGRIPHPIIRVADPDPVGSGPFWQDPDPEFFYRIRIRILAMQTCQIRHKIVLKNYLFSIL